MYTLDYLKTLYAEYEEWDLDPGSFIWPTSRFSFEKLDNNTLYNLVEIEDEAEEEFVDTIRELIQEYLLIGTVKSFRLKDHTGKVLCEYDDGFYG